MNSDLRQTIEQLKQERNAIILAHNYQAPEIQELADLTGDSLELSRRAAATSARVIVFCGVHFMAETAAILNPEKTVLLPNPEAGCPMADMIGAADLREVRRRHPGVPIITYVNSSAAVKAESTICCTSANSIQVVASFPDAATVYMAPDQNLALYTARHTSKTILHWNGYCPIHHHLTAAMVVEQRQAHPEALFLAHPECLPEVIDLADVVRSTSGMIRFIQESDRQSFIIGTEQGILYPMRKLAPEKQFFPASAAMICPNMKKTRPRHVLTALQHLQPRITVPEDIRLRALNAVERMIAIG